MSILEDAKPTDETDSITLAPSEDGAGAEKPGNETQGKWAAALHTLSDEDRQLFESLHLDSQKPALTVLQDVLAETNKKKEECVKKRIKVKIKGREIVIRDVLDKISAWVTKFISIGDVIVQYDPAHAALPWAAVRFVLQTAVSDFEMFDFALSSIERLVNYITISSIFEVQYLQPKHHHLNAYPQLSKAVESLYANVLKFLGYLLRYFGSSTIARHLKSIVVSKKDIESKFQPIEVARLRVDELSRLMTAEHTEEEFQDLQDKLEELHRPIVRIADHMEAINDGLERDTRVRILKAISTIPYPVHHKTARKGRLEGSGAWLLRSKAFLDWRSESISSVLWLHGIPGSGKTKLASLVVDELVQTNKVAYFYCIRNPAEPHRGQCDKVMASIVRQLASLKPGQPILDPVIEQYREAIDGFSEFEDQAWSIEESERVMLELLAEYPAVTIILDALDEVNYEERQTLMDVLSRLIQKSPNLLKIFISSRDNYDIVLQLAESPNIYIDADENAEDIASFINDRLDNARLLHGKLPADLRDTIVQTLKTGARGMFRWVELQIQSLVPLKVAADIRDRLGKLPPTLEGSYWELYNTILESGKHASKLAIFTFQWLLYAQKVVTKDNFATIASASFQIEEPDGETMGSGSPEAITTGEILDVCANLVVLRNEVFVLAHLSVREFLEGLTTRNVDTMMATRGNAAIAAACLRLFLSRVESAYGELQEPAMADSARDTKLAQTSSQEVTATSAEANELSKSGHASKSATTEADSKTDDNDSKNDSSVPEAGDNTTEPSPDGSNNDTITIKIEDQQVETEPIQVKIATKLLGGQNPHALIYSCVHWVEHVVASAELRTRHPLTSLLTKLLVNAKDSAKVTISFQVWHAMATDLKDRNQFPFHGKLQEAARDQPSPIWVACLYNWSELVQQIYQLNRYYDINKERLIESIKAPKEWDIVSSHGIYRKMTPLVYAAVSGDVKLTTLILDYTGKDIRWGDLSIGTHPLVGAAASGDSEMVSMWLERDHGGLETEADALRAAAGSGRAETMTLLLEHNAELISKGGYKAVNFACARGQKEAVVMLVEAGAPTVRGANFVASATYYKHYDVVKYLLDKEIGLSGRAQALNLAVSHGDDKGAAILREYGAKREPAAVIRAIKAGTRTSAFRLIEAGFDVQRHHFIERDTPLHVAAQRGYTDLVSALIKAGAFVNAKNRSGQTPLHVAAAQKGSYDTCKLLIEAEADTLMEDQTGHVPLDIAEQGSDEVVENLIRGKMEDLWKELRDWDKTRGQTIATDDESSKIGVIGKDGHEINICE